MAAHRNEHDDLVAIAVHAIDEYLHRREQPAPTMMTA
jgi:hypothetical protein